MSLAARDSELRRWSGRVDRRICQTFAASPAEPGELPLGFRIPALDRWQQQAERVAALAITDQRKEPAPAQPYSRRRWLRTPIRELLFLWIVGLMCGGVLFLSLKGGS